MRSFPILPLLLSGLLLFSSCTVVVHDPYPIYEKGWGSTCEMPEAMAFKYVERYLRASPHFNYDRLMRVSIRYSYVGDETPWRMWRIGARVVYRHYADDWRSMDIAVKVRAYDGRIMNVPD